MKIPQNINKKNAAIMGLIGLFLGIIGSMFITLSAIGPGQEPNQVTMLLTIILLTFTFGFWGSQMNIATDKQIELPIKSVRIILIFCWLSLIAFKIKHGF